MTPDYPRLNFPAVKLRISQRGEQTTVWDPLRGIYLVLVDDRACPLMLVECKAAGIGIDRQVLAQAVRYNSVLGARYVVLTNGLTHYCYECADGRYTRMDRFPRL